MNIEKLQRFRHDSRGVHEDQGGDYLWYDDVVTLIEEDKKERERCVEVLKSAIGLKVEGKKVSHPMDSLKSRLAELEGIAERLGRAVDVSLKAMETAYERSFTGMLRGFMGGKIDEVKAILAYKGKK